MKVVYQNDTKKFADFQGYSDLVNQAVKAFGIVQFGESIKFYYMDNDGDIISISNQSDLDEARTEPSLKLVIANSVEEARAGLSACMNRSEYNLNQSMTSNQYVGGG